MAIRAATSSAKLAIQFVTGSGLALIASRAAARENRDELEPWVHRSEGAGREDRPGRDDGRVED